MIEYTEEERRAVDAARKYFDKTGTLPICPLCMPDNFYFTLGEHISVDGDTHTVTWRCDRGHVLSCNDFIWLLNR